MWRVTLGLLVIAFWGTSVLADQQVVLQPADSAQNQTDVLNVAFDTAILQEMAHILGAPLTPGRQALVMSVLSAERTSFISGYSEASASNLNATTEETVLNVRVGTDALRTRLRELGVMASVNAPLPYVLTLSGVEPSRTKRLGALQELSGLAPRSAGENMPELKLSQLGAWTGVLSHGDWSSSHSARNLDEVWFTLWKRYFSRSDMAENSNNGIRIRVSGWLSSQGPMEFDRMMETWSAEVDHKVLVGVEMDGPGMAAVWLIQTRTRDALIGKLNDAARARGLTLAVP